MTKKLISELSDDELREMIKQIFEEQGLLKKGQEESRIQLNLDAPGARESLGRVYGLLSQWGREAQEAAKKKGDQDEH